MTKNSKIAEAWVGTEITLYAYISNVQFCFMTGTEVQTAPFQRVSLTLIALAIVATTLILGRQIILPLLFGVLLSTLLLPLTNYLSRKGFHKLLSIAIPVLLTLVLAGGLIYFLSSQIMNFLNDTPTLKERFNEVGTSFKRWINQSTHVTVRKQDQYIKDTVDDFKDRGPQLVGMTFGGITGLLNYIVLLPIYTFLMLFYRHRIKAFIIGIFKNGSESRVREILSESASIAQQYVTGLLIETAIVFTLNVVGFLILGIKYPIFLALFAALLNLVPYVGMLVANIFCMVVTMASSEDLHNVLWVGIILAFVQIIDNNFSMPFIVGNKVRINSLVTIVGVIVGGALCGIPGMFLAIPTLAVLKVIFDKIPGLTPWGLLLGDEDVTPISNLVIKGNDSKSKVGGPTTPD
jgi:predicted PurR-regulated permease PerM